MAAREARTAANAPPSSELLAQLHARLLRAVAVRKAGCSAYYAPSLRHGLYCYDCERSAAATGEDPAEFRRHLSRFDRFFGKLLGFWHEENCGNGRLPMDECRLESSVLSFQSSSVRCPSSVAVDRQEPAWSRADESRVARPNSEDRTTNPATDNGPRTTDDFTNTENQIPNSETANSEPQN